MKTPLHLALLFLLSTSLLCCTSTPQAVTGITPAKETAIQTTLQEGAVTALADLLVKKPGRIVLTDAATAALSSVATQAQAQGGGTAVVTLTAAGQAALRDYLAKASTTQELSDAGLAALQVLVK